MKASFKNSSANSRIAQIKGTGTLLLIFALVLGAPLVIPSYAAFLDKSGKSVLPATFWAALELIVIAFLGFYAFFVKRVILNIEIDSPRNYVSVTLVPPFKWREKKIECKLSQTQIQTDFMKQKRHRYSNIVVEYYIVYLIHPNFGTVDVPVPDGPERKEVYLAFQKLKENVAASIRNRM